MGKFWEGVVELNNWNQNRLSEIIVKKLFGYAASSPLEWIAAITIGVDGVLLFSGATWNLMKCSPNMMVCSQAWSNFN